MTIATEKLYWYQPGLARFTARVLDSRLEADRRAVALDRTAFYPTGGGQPCDVGKLSASQVVDVEITEDGRIWHWLDGDADFAAGAEVECEVNWQRRREMMQQHTGQHILSQAFFQLFGAETRGFRITDRAAEIDLTLELQPDEIEPALIRAEELANDIVFDNREIRIHEVTPEEAARLPLRKESFITDCIRLIEIAEYDWSPCGGTHAQRTGEVGLIAIRARERAKKMTRVHFVCGVRALRDYRAANRTAEAVALKFSAGRDEAEAAVARLIDENKRLSRRARELGELAAKVEADELLETASADKEAGPRVINRVYEDRDFEEVKLIAHRLVERGDAIALLAARESDTARLVFARSVGIAADMNALMKAACEKLGGRGGGKPDFAQGGGTRLSELTATMELAKGML
jgi:alanyl-tRNA synthetase